MSFSLKLNVSCDVELRRGDRLLWESNNPKAFLVTESPNGLEIRQISGGSSGVTVISSGRSRSVVMSSGSNIVIGDSVDGNVVIGGSSGGLWIKGKRVDESSFVDEPMPETPRLIVYVPDATFADLRFSSSVSVYGDARFSVVTLRTSGSCEVALRCHSASVSTSGSSDISLVMTGGTLKTQCSGSTSISVAQV